MQGILWGTGGAIALRVVLIAFALTLLVLPFVKLEGGALLLWRGIKLMAPHADSNDIQGRSTLLTALQTIILHTFVISLDHLVAFAAAAQGAPAERQVVLV